MTSNPIIPHRLRMLELLAVGFFISIVTIGLQIKATAYTAEFSDDSASHYISGLMIHDFIRSGAFGSPVEYLKRFHSHYPLVGIGHWPPLYYLIEAMWMLLFSTGRSSLLVLSAFFTVLTAMATYAFATPRLGRPAGLFAAVAFVATSLVQKGTSYLMLDVPVTFFCFVSMIAYVGYLESGKARYSALFGVLAAAAMMVKGNAGALALLPLFVILFGRRWDLLSKWSFWLPLPIVGALVGPWYFVTYKLAAPGFRYTFGINYFITATADNGHILLGVLGPLGLIAAIIGLLAVIVRRGRANPSGSALVATAALFASVWTFQSVVPAAIQDRYLAPALPPVLMLAAWGSWVVCDWAVKRMPTEWTMRRRAPLVNGLGVAALALSCLPGAATIERKPHLGLIAAAAEVWAHRPEANPAVLVVAKGLVEASAIAELAMDDPHRPSLFVIRGSRLLGAGGYNNSDYEPRFRTPDQAMAALDSYAVPLVLFQEDPSSLAWAHIRQVEEARRIDPGRWTLVYRDSQSSPATEVLLVQPNYKMEADVKKLSVLSAPRALIP